MIGSVLEGKYRLIRLVGEGGMGAVYEAEHTLLGRHVAIKVLAPEFARKADLIKRFVREAQAAARIGHENICEVTDIGQTPNGLPYAVMQVLQGRSLGATLREGGPLGIGRCIDIASQTLDALGAAHAANIVHRDVKPDNIFLTHLAGRDDFVKVLDFGISKVRGVTGSSAQLTQTGTVLGTPAYMSPEQARGETDVDARTDVWAAGVVVFEMLTGRVPFPGVNYNHILYQVLTVPIPSLRSLREAVTPELEAAVMGALERDAAKRHPSAAAFRKALLAASLTVGEIGGRGSGVGGQGAGLKAQGSGLRAQGPGLRAPESPAAEQQPTTNDQQPPAVAGSGERIGSAEPTVGATAVPLRTTPGVWGRVRRRPAPVVAVGVLVLAAVVGAVLVVARGRGGEGRSRSVDEAQGSRLKPPAARTVPTAEPTTDDQQPTTAPFSPGPQEAAKPALAEPPVAPPVEQATAPSPVAPAPPPAPPPASTGRGPATDAGSASAAGRATVGTPRPRDAGAARDRALPPPAAVVSATVDAGPPPLPQPTTDNQQPTTAPAPVDGGQSVLPIPIRTTHRDAGALVEAIPIRTTHGGDR